VRFEEKFQLGSARLKDWDYSQDGFYFVTICSYSRANIFGEIRNDQMILGDFGKIVERCWRAIPTHFVNVNLDKFVIMPNHLHGIVVIDNPNPKNTTCLDVETLHATFLQNQNTMFLNTRKTNYYSKISPKPNSLSTVIRSFKSAVTKNIHQITPALDRVWQNNFFDHIIRDDEELNRIRDYIILNPKLWNEDKENLKLDSSTLI